MKIYFPFIKGDFQGRGNMNHERIAVTRRDFVRGSVGTALGAAAVGTEVFGQAIRQPRSSQVILVRDEKVMSGGRNIDAGILKAMLAEAITRMARKSSVKEAWLSLMKTSDVVGLISTPHLNPTHREVVDLVRESLVESGFPAGKIVEAQGGPDQAKACTALIALPALKAHWLTGIGTVLKNYITYSGYPSSYHDANNVRLGEIWLMPHVKGKTKIVLVDALRPLCDKGPQPDPRYLWDYKGIIAGTDPVAVEAVCLKIINQKRQALRGEPWPLSPPPLCVAAADEKYGLGTHRWEEIRLEKIGWTEQILI
jgi:hypothetical protein